VPAFIKRLAIACVAGLGLFGLAGAASAEPALWAIRDGRSVIYLFGTFHLLDPAMDWESPKIAKAFGESGDLWLELIDDDDPANQALVARLGLDTAHPLSSKLPPADLARLDRSAKAAGIGAGEKQLEPMRPWMAAMSLALVSIKQAGFDPQKGADHVLKGQAQAAGKTLRGFETALQQLHLFADLPPALELEILQSSIDEAAEVPAKAKDMAQAWSSGDVPAIGKLFAEMDDPKYRAVYQVMIVDRNQAWAAKLAERLKTGHGTSFVAVGTGHLVGPDSLIVALARRGIKVERE
jgi:uncharacterized protein